MLSVVKYYNFGRVGLIYYSILYPILYRTVSGENVFLSRAFRLINKIFSLLMSLIPGSRIPKLIIILYCF